MTMQTSVGPVKNREYSTSPFNCCANGCCGCLYAFCCFPCANGKVADAVGQGYCSTCTCTCCFPCLAVCCCHIDNRSRLNKMYKVKDSCGTGCSGCLYACFCGCCKVIQELRLIDDAHINGWTAGGGGDVTVITQMHMTPAPMGQQQMGMYPMMQPQMDMGMRVNNMTQPQMAGYPMMPQQIPMMPQQMAYGTIVPPNMVMDPMMQAQMNNNIAMQQQHDLSTNASAQMINSAGPQVAVNPHVTANPLMQPQVTKEAAPTPAQASSDSDKEPTKGVDSGKQVHVDTDPNV